MGFKAYAKFGGARHQVFMCNSIACVRKNSVAIIYIPTGQRPHFAGAGHTKPILKEVKDQVLLGLWTCRVYLMRKSYRLRDRDANAVEAGEFRPAMRT